MNGAEHGARVRGAVLAHRSVGEGPVTVVGIHGWMTSGAVMDDLAAAFRPGTLRFVAVDLAGTGASERPPTGYGLERHAADVAALLDTFDEPVVLLGHSMGGQIAQLVAASVPRAVRGLVLVNPVPLRGMTLPEEVHALFSSAAGDAEKFGAILDRATRELGDEPRARLLRAALDVNEACITEGYEAWTAGASEEPLDRIRAPTLVIATDDPFLPPAFLEQTVVSRIRGARLVHLKGPGHYPIVERPEETARIVEAFVAEL